MASIAELQELKEAYADPGKVGECDYCGLTTNRLRFIVSKDTYECCWCHIRRWNIDLDEVLKDRKAFAELKERMSELESDPV